MRLDNPILFTKMYFLKFNVYKYKKLVNLVRSLVKIL